MSETILSVKDLKVNYGGIEAVKGISFDVPEGQIVTLIGACGFRIVWIYTVFAYFRTIPSLYLLYIFSWTITAIAEIIYFIVSYKRLRLTGCLLPSGE